MPSSGFSVWPKYESPFFSHINLDLESEGAKRRWYELRLASRYPFWFAIDTFDTKLIGELALRELDRRKRSTRLGIHLSPSYIGQGLGSDALGALLEFYFGELGFRHMHLDVARYNQRAIRCYQKCGFVKVSEFLRGNLTGVRVLKDKNLEEFWDCFVEKNGREYAIFWEMVADSPNVNVSGR
jgi:RimJ/RimL family protein N-acetyltransferase